MSENQDDFPNEYETVEEDVLATNLTAQPNQVLQRTKKGISLQQGIAKRYRIGQRYLASCGHIIHDFSEIGGKCQEKNCNNLVCVKCLRICQRCMKPICPKHTKMHDGQSYCGRCKWLELFFGGRKENGEQRERRGTPWYRKSIGDYLFK